MSGIRVQRYLVLTKSGHHAISRNKADDAEKPEANKIQCCEDPGIALVTGRCVIPGDSESTILVLHRKDACLERPRCRINVQKTEILSHSTDHTERVVDDRKNFEPPAASVHES